MRDFNDAVVNRRWMALVLRHICDDALRVVRMAGGGRANGGVKSPGGTSLQKAANISIYIEITISIGLIRVYLKFVRDYGVDHCTQPDHVH